MCVFFDRKSKNFLEKYNEIWEKVSHIIKESNSESVDNNKNLKAGKTEKLKTIIPNYYQHQATFGNEYFLK